MTIQGTPPPRIVCLSNVRDQNYDTLRNEAMLPCLSAPKRRDLFRCLESALGREALILSAPPRATNRKSARWLPPLETRFSTHRQLFCENWDAAKWRIPCSWFFYARHVLKNTRNGDLVLIDNYEIIYIIAAWVLRLFRHVTFVLDYEDGKHLIDRSYSKTLSGLAEVAGKPLIQAAILAHPQLGMRLPESVPTELVPGFYVPSGARASTAPMPPVRFLYTGSLDSARGVKMLLEALAYLPESGWRLDITGSGPLSPKVKALADEPRWRDRVAFHGVLERDAFQTLVAQAHIGLNCQLSGDPISSVTFPSKIFSYLSAGLIVLSSRASEVPAICKEACIYFDEETPASLAEKMKTVIQDTEGYRSRLEMKDVAERYSTEGTAIRLKRLIEAVLPRR